MNRAGAIIVMSTFAAIWWIVGTAQVRPGSLAISGVGILISGLMMAIAWRRRGPSVSRDLRQRRGRAVGIASTVEGAAILAAVIVLSRVGRRDLIAPAIAVIVGLHFLPLARWLRAPLYYLTAALLIGVGIAGAFLSDPASRGAAVGTGAAAVLWLSCGVVLIRAEEQLEPLSRFQ